MNNGEERVLVTMGVLRHAAGKGKKGCFRENGWVGGGESRQRSDFQVRGPHNHLLLLIFC